MEIFLVIIGIIVLLCLLSIGGWILEILRHIISFIFQGVGHCFGNVFGCIVWIIAIFFFLGMLASL